MSATGLDVFDTTLHKTNIWLNDLMQVLGWPDRHKAYLALRTTLHACATGSRWRRWRNSVRSSRCSSVASTTKAGIRRASR